MHADISRQNTHTWTHDKGKQSHLLKALLISEQLQVLVELQMMLLKEAVEG